MLSRKNSGANSKLKTFHTPVCVSNIQTTVVPHGNGTLDNHHCIGIHLKYFIYYIFNSRGIEEILMRIIIRRDRYDNKNCIPIATPPIMRGSNIQLCRSLLGRIICPPALIILIYFNLIFCHVCFNITTLYRTFSVINQIHPFRNNIHTCDPISLSQQCDNIKTYISSTCNCFIS